jgi:tRNA-dihydrouridine synthase C
MEGVTEPCFRDLVLALHSPKDLGGAFTEFARVSQVALPAGVLRRHLGPARHRQPVGLQLMGSDPELVAATAVHAVSAGAPLVDLNFGCPAKGALRGCAGSALLDDPARVEALVRAVAGAIPGTPVTAKIRAGGADDRHLEDLARAAEAGGAAMLTLHCRTRSEAYAERAADWRRIARAVTSVGIPVCGNGDVAVHADLERVRRETGCAYAMVGRGALADPWVFSGERAARPRAAQFLLDYADALQRRARCTPQGAVARVKQLLNFWTAGDLFTDDAERRRWLRERAPEALLAHVRALAGPPSTTSPPRSSTAGGESSDARPECAARAPCELAGPLAS